MKLHVHYVEINLYVERSIIRNANTKNSENDFKSLFTVPFTKMSSVRKIAGDVFYFVFKERFILILRYDAHIFGIRNNFYEKFYNNNNRKQYLFLVFLNML